MKGRKESVCNANFMVGICYRKGVITVKQYFGQITGANYANITEQCLAPALERSIQPRARRILQDGVLGKILKKLWLQWPTMQSKFSRSLRDHLTLTQ